ncbi:MAG: aspartate carbamoyltransferase catalytic subunit [Bacteroidota bacterium]|nr:aspartate carbamoyltransferase catalytic subunit [Bacteroidota bacterium]MDP4234473.1 aspartate carbamoyltransferase catalytic subunit [Bacteroidota bacterium]MDP4244179.1 aspartate carbamoyltransferase catalytic subunit [Bacteroidota bacterium]MDP4288820.1 aspartate carbamoyltransferase catalytic subunit [Bacteroidota bacterium]
MRQDLLTTEHLPAETTQTLLDRSDYYLELLKRPGRWTTPSWAMAKPPPISLRSQEGEPILKGYTIANLFFEASTRTRTSFELAERRLGADVVTLTPAVSSLSKGESVLDTVRVLEAMRLDAIVVRHASAGIPQFLADHLPEHVHVINAGDGAHEHPTQALLDAAEMRTALGALRGKHVAIVGDILHSRVARSNVWLLKSLGARVTFVAPETLMPRDAAEVFGIKTTTNLDEVLPTADAIMMLRIQLERQARGFFPSLEEYRAQYGMTPERMSRSKALILHPGPINHGIELDSETAYGERSLVLRQVKRGVAVRMAVLELLFSITS